jgi:hypothetical protein
VALVAEIRRAKRELSAGPARKIDRERGFVEREDAVVRTVVHQQCKSTRSRSLGGTDTYLTLPTRRIGCPSRVQRGCIVEAVGIAGDQGLSRRDAPDDHWRRRKTLSLGDQIVGLDLEECAARDRKLVRDARRASQL